MPRQIDLRVGDTLFISNGDSYDQTVGPYYVKSGKQLSLTYGAPGRYEGYCPIGANDSYLIVVTA